MKKKTHKCLCILWPSSLHDIKHNKSQYCLPLSFKACFFFLKQMLVICPFSLFCGSLLTYEVVLIMFHLHSPPSELVCMCVCCIGIPAYSTFLWRNWLPLMGQEKPLKGKLWLFLSSLSPYLFRPRSSTPTPSFLLLVLTSPDSSLWIFSPTPSFHITIFIYFWRNKRSPYSCFHSLHSALILNTKSDRQIPSA